MASQEKKIEKDKISEKKVATDTIGCGYCQQPCTLKWYPLKFYLTNCCGSEKIIGKAQLFINDADATCLKCYKLNCGVEWNEAGQAISACCKHQFPEYAIFPLKRRLLTGIDYTKDKVKYICCECHNECNLKKGPNKYHCLVAACCGKMVR
jgi:hypothetical protein